MPLESDLLYFFLGNPKERNDVLLNHWLKTAFFVFWEKNCNYFEQESRARDLVWFLPSNLVLCNLVSSTPWVRICLFVRLFLGNSVYFLGLPSQGYFEYSGKLAIVYIHLLCKSIAEPIVWSQLFDLWDRLRHLFDKETDICFIQKQTLGWGKHFSDTETDICLSVWCLRQTQTFVLYRSRLSEIYIYLKQTFVSHRNLSVLYKNSNEEEEDIFALRCFPFTKHLFKLGNTFRVICKYFFCLHLWGLLIFLLDIKSDSDIHTCSMIRSLRR